MADLFDKHAQEYYREHAPLAERMRPQSLDDFYGQADWVGEGKSLRQMIEIDNVHSLIFWGPPGSGKTTLARIIAGKTGRRFVPISAVHSGVKDLHRILSEAKEALKYEQRGTILFIDEIHRFNKGQQDVLLHGSEDGTITLIGATTENPSFEVNSALLSRMQVIVLEPLPEDALQQIVANALDDAERGLGTFKLQLAEEGKQAVIRYAGGDARRALNLLERAADLAAHQKQKTISAELILEAAGTNAIRYDKRGEEHYNIISAFIKSMRGSDPDAALYYLARMMEGGEDPLFIARRLVIFASEDIGNADPQALSLAIACKDAVHFVGLPECLYPLSQCTVYLASAAKSNASGAGYFAAQKEVKQQGPLPVPLHIRNAPTTFMKNLGYGKEYLYPHSDSDAIVNQTYLPDILAGKTYYHPVARGFEREIIKRLEYYNRQRQNKNPPQE